MVRRTDWEDTLRAWSKPPGTTEQIRCENALSVVKRAVRAHPPLEGMNLDFYVKGSNANGTNVKVDSDVDVGVCYRDAWYSDFEGDLSWDAVGLVDHPYRVEDLRAEVETALVRAFGRGADPGTVAIHLRENTYRVRADVVACFEHRRYYRAANGRILYHRGEEFHPPSRAVMRNWPEQNYSSGVDKNDRTGRRYKPMVRSLKALRNEMEDDGVAAASPICSFLIESLVWNVPNDQFGNQQYTTDLRNVLVYLWNGTEGPGGCDGWAEVNDLNYLIQPAQSWTRQDVRAFIQGAWNYLGFR